LPKSVRINTSDRLGKELQKVEFIKYEKIEESKQEIYLVWMIWKQQ